MPSSQKIWDRSSLTRLGVGIGGSLPKPSPGTESFLLPPAAACVSLPHTCLSNLASETDASAIQGGMVCWIQCFPITLLWLSHTQSSLLDLTSLTLSLRIVKPPIVHYWREISICWSSTCPGSLRSRSCWGRFCDFAFGYAQNDKVEIILWWEKGFRSKKPNKRNSGALSIGFDWFICLVLNKWCSYCWICCCKL